MFLSHLPQYVDIFPRRILVERDSRGFAQQVDGTEECAPAFGPDTMFQVFPCLPVSDKQQGVAILRVQADPAVPAPFMFPDQGEECLQGLKKLTEFARIGPYLDCQFHTLLFLLFSNGLIP